MPLDIISPSEQVANFLRGELGKGVWRGDMPGAPKLAAELVVDPKTVIGALSLLEDEGILLPQGVGRPRRINEEAIHAGSRPLRIAFLLFESGDERKSYIVELKHRLLEAGHSVVMAPRSLTDLRMDVARVERMVDKVAADAWVVLAGSGEILSWFAERPEPAFAFFGRMRRVNIAGSGPEKTDAYLSVARRLMELGHQRIVYLARPEAPTAGPRQLLQLFFEELQAGGVAVGPYNYPDWEPTADGLRRCLDSLFAVTPPTALFIDEITLFTAATQHLSRLGIVAPEHVSLICTDPDRSFEWCRPTIAHIDWSIDKVVRSAERWAAAVSHGRDPRRKPLVKAEFVDGGTVGPAPQE